MAKVKKTVIIGKKMYKMPDWNFGDIRKLESSGFSIMKLKSPDQNIFSALSAFVAVAANVDTDEADALIEAHVENGGDVRALLSDFYTALGASHFFAKMLGTMTNSEASAPEKSEDE